jgi:SAM-dependent methyltransferase
VSVETGPREGPRSASRTAGRSAYPRTANARACPLGRVPGTCARGRTKAAPRATYTRNVARQNIYDDQAFFEGYRNLRENLIGLHENVIAPMLPTLVPELAGQRVVDLGCGEGWFCRVALTQGATSVIGIDPSERMLALARERTTDRSISYVRTFAEDADLPAESVDVVVSILALHYVAEFAQVVESIARWLVPGGVLVAVVEHPVATSQDPHEGFTMESDVKVAWPVNHYFDEGERKTEWYVEGVVKYHRRIDTMLNTIIAAGFEIERVSEPAPTREAARKHARSRGGLVSPDVLGVRGRKKLRE